jgi:hypothetical protein
MENIFPVNHFFLSDLYFDERERIGKNLLSARIPLWQEEFGLVAKQILPHLQVLAQCYARIPPAVLEPLEWLFTLEFCRKTRVFFEQPTEENFLPVLEINKTAKIVKAQLDISSIKEILPEKLMSLFLRIAENKEDAASKNACMLLEFVHQIPVPIELRNLQNRMYGLLQTQVKNWIGSINNIQKQADLYNFVLGVIHLAELLNLNVDEVRNKIKTVS